MRIFPVTDDAVVVLAKHSYPLVFLTTLLSVCSFAKDATLEDLSVQVDSIPVSANTLRWRANPLIVTYEPQQYGGSPLLKDIVEDENGVLYITQYGPTILTTDGTSFTHIQAPFNQKDWHSIHFARDTMWISCAGENADFGYITKDQFGQYIKSNYHSLKSLLPNSIREPRTFKIISHHGATFFLFQGGHLVRWKGGKLHVWSLTVYRLMFVVHDKLYLPSGTRLFEVTGDSLKPLPIWDQIKQEVTLMLPFDENRILLGSRNKLFVYDGARLTPFATRLNREIENLRLYHATKLNDSIFVLGTLNNGVLIVSKEGDLLMVVNRENGLTSNVVNEVMCSTKGDIWVTTLFGLNKIELSSPFGYLDHQDGLLNTPEAFARHHDTLYIVNRNGLFFLDESTRRVKPLRFKQVGSRKMWLSAVESTPEGLLIGSVRQGLWQLKDGGIRLIQGPPTNITITKVLQLRADPTLFMIRYFDSIHLMQRENKQWVYLGKIFDSDGEYDIVEDYGGNFWIPADKGLTSLVIDEFYVSKNTIKEALLSGKFTIKIHLDHRYACLIDSLLVAFGPGKIDYYDKQQQQFRPYELLQPVPGVTDYQIFNGVQASTNDLWFYSRPTRVPVAQTASTKSGVSGKIFVHARKTGGRYEWDNEAFQRLWKEIGEPSIIYPDKNGAVWFGGHAGKVMLYLPEKRNNVVAPLRVQLTQVGAINPDSTLFRGHANSLSIPLALPFAYNSLRFNYSAVSFDMADSTYYRYQLDGFDPDWSRWTHETQKDYTGLPPGAYRFKVQAIDYRGRISNVAQASLSIIPPWYRTVWTYAFLVVALVAGIYGVVKIRVRHLEAEKEKLEQLVNERTAEIRAQKQQLEEMTQIKDRFFSNISHEFRTPLSLILGPLKKLLNNEPVESTSRLYPIMYRNAQRLLRLINQLLELSRINAGKSTLRASKQDLVHFLRILSSNYSSMATSKQIAYSFKTSIPSCDAYFDPDKMEKVVYNLLSNAFKFTPPGGRITVALDVHEPDGPGEAVISISDTGTGIAASEQNKIFDRFYQVDPSYTRETEGTGIGLALTKELIELHHGSISVESNVGSGSTFVVTLPLGKQYLSEQEIVQTSAFEFPASSNYENPTPAPNKPITPEKSQQILIVEDNADMRDFIGQILGSRYQILEASNGIEGLKVAQEHLPDLIISDVMMPKMDGMEFCHRIKNDPRTDHIPMIMLTAKSEHQHRLEGINAGVDDYLFKPFDDNELLALIDNRIHQRTKLHEKWRRLINLRGVEIPVTTREERFLMKAKEAVVHQIANEEFGVSELAHEMALSRSQLHRKLRALMDKSATAFIREIRLEHARHLISGHAGTISEIAYASGFSSPQYFSQCFTRYYGYPPGKARDVVDTHHA